MHGAADEPRETSSATTRLLLAYVHEHTGDAGVERLLAAAGVPHTRAELEDPSRWVSYDTRIRLFTAAVDELGDPSALFSVGASVMTASVSPSLALLLRALGSTAQVFRQLPRAVSKFSTTSTMTVLEANGTSAAIRFRLHAGYAPSRLDCDYARGLISQVPVVFGLPPAHIVHTVCQADGHEACDYHVTWSRRYRWSRGRRADDLELLSLRQQLHELQSASGDLVHGDDLSEVLQRVTERAASSVLARGYLLAVRPADGGEPLVHSTGVPTDERDDLAARLLAGADLGPSAVVVDVASARHSHGRLAALYAPGQVGLPDERRLLAAYASHAAAALDLLAALDDSRRDGDRSRALLALAHQLAGVDDTAEVARLVTEVLPVVVGCTHAAVLLWDHAAGELRTAATVGLPPEGDAVLRSVVLRPADVPELTAMVTTLQPMATDADAATPALRALLQVLGVEHCLVVPLVAGGELLGVATASWGRAPSAHDAPELLRRLSGVTDQAGTALHGARLLSTVRHQALHDALTGLPNRVLFAERLGRALAEPSRPAVLFCDLDRFKAVNDQYGHAAGDELLRQVATRLRSTVPEGASVGRLSGDEFAVLLPTVDGDEAERAAAALVDGFEHPFRIEGRELRVTMSIGVAHAAPGEVHPDALLRASDGAMYEAKQRGRNQIGVAGPAAAPPVGSPVVAAPASLERELRTALREGQLHLLYQPICALTPGDGAATPSVVGVEALVRWDHPRLGPLSPAVFLPVAEECGLVAELDLWVLHEATRAVAAWSAEHGCDRPRVAVNLSGVGLVDPRLRPAVLEALARSGLAPRRLELEVVESRALVDLPGIADRLAALRHLGISIALDDFGTGFSTLTWLQQLPADRVKLDRTFTAALTSGVKGRALVRGVLALAAELGLEVVAEGVETVEQRDALLEEGCPLAQGYLLGAPVPLATALGPALVASV